jgi:cytochrome c oxidase subunit 4
VTDAAETESMWSVWRPHILVWLALVALLCLTVVLAYLPLGSFNVVWAIGIAAIKVALVVMLFMELKRPNALVRLSAAAGLLWLIVLFVLTLSDILTRASGN